MPLAFRLPGRLAPERRDDLSMLVDVFPTIVDLVDRSPARKDLDGRALCSPRRTGGSRRPFPSIGGFEGGTYVSRMVRQGPLKLQETRDEARGQERVRAVRPGR